MKEQDRTLRSKEMCREGYERNSETGKRMRMQKMCIQRM